MAVGSRVGPICVAITIAAGPACGGSPASGGDGGAIDSAAGGAGGAASVDAAADAAPQIVDDDGDGLDDGWEQMVAEAYLPFLSLDPADGCPLGGIVYRLRPHPADPTLILILYDHLLQNDCGLNGHVGDDEA